MFYAVVYNPLRAAHPKSLLREGREGIDVIVIVTVTIAIIISQY